MSVLAAMHSYGDGYSDIGSPTARWNAVHLFYVRGRASYLEPARLAQRSEIVYNTTSTLMYLAVVEGKWGVTLLDTRLPDPTWLDNNTFAAVVEGEWSHQKSKYTLPAALDEDDYLMVQSGLWLSTPLDIVLPPAVTYLDDGYLLLAVNGEWTLSDSDNFYLPTITVITPEVQHVVTVSAGKWLLRPLDAMSEHMDGLVKVPGDADVALCGDGEWRDVNKDYGNMRVGDVRLAQYYDPEVWVPLDGSTIGKEGKHNSAAFLELYTLLDPNARWENGDLVHLENRPGAQVRYAAEERHPIDLVLYAGPVDDGPYTLEMSRDPNFSSIEYVTTSDGDAHNWPARDGVFFCYLGGITCEHYSGEAEVVVPASVLAAGFYHIRVTSAAGVRFDGVCITEDDIARLPTMVSAGSYPSGSTARTATFRQQLYTVNGRPIHMPYHTTYVGLDGVAMGPKNRIVSAASGSLVNSYGIGDEGSSTAVARSGLVRDILAQLSHLDPYSINTRVPKFRLIKLPFAVANSNWWGALCGDDARVYCIPHSANTVLIYNPKTDKFTTWGTLGFGYYKWAGGVKHTNGKMYCMPYYDTTILVIDPRNRRITRERFGLDQSYYDKGQWVGACVMPDRRILSVTSSGYGDERTEDDAFAFELEIFPDEGEAHIYDLNTARAARYSDVASGGFVFPEKEPHPAYFFRERIKPDLIDLPFARKHTDFGGLSLDATGAAVPTPCGHWTVDATTKKFPRFQVDHDIPYRDLVYWGLYNYTDDNNASMDQSHCQIAPDSSVSMSRRYSFGRYDYRETYLDNVPDGYESGFYDDKKNVFLRMKFLGGGVLAPDGNTYFIPCGGDVPLVGVRHPDGSMGSFRVSDPRYANCRGGILGPDGNIYSACADGTAAFALNPRTRTLRIIETGHRKLPSRYTAWMGCVVGPDGHIYFPPFDSEYMLIVDPCVPCNGWPAELNSYINKF